MKLVTRGNHDDAITEVIAEGVLFHSPGEGLQLLIDATGLGNSKVILYQENLPAEFFDLKTKLAGEILQKAVNFHIQVAVVGSFEAFESESLKAFIRESNRGRHFFFVASVEAAEEILRKKTF